MFTCHDHIRDLFHTLDTDVLILPHHRDVVDHHAKPIRLDRAEIVAIEQPEIVESVSIPSPSSAVILQTDEYDADLDFELSAVGEDQQKENALDNALMRFTPKQRTEALESVDVWDAGIDFSTQRSA